MLQYSTEFRHLPTTARHKLIALLDLQDNWKSLAAIVTNPDRPSENLFKSTQIEILEQQRKRSTASSCANAMLEYWGTYGRRRHTLGQVVGFLEQCSLNRAANIIRECVENGQQKELDFETSWNDLPDYSSRAESVKPSAPNQSLISFDSVPETVPLSFTFDCVRIATDNFDLTNKLGEGTFGQVFKASADILNIPHVEFVAVKRLKSSNNSGIQQNNNDQWKDRHSEFIDELNTMCRFRHPNLVSLLGYCNDGPDLCLITEFLELGSLQDYFIALRKQEGEGKGRKLSLTNRLNIALDIARALAYLHTYVEADTGKQHPYVHRDIKSANILLDRHLNARVADLGLVREGSSLTQTSTVVVTSTIIGTSVYMAPEAFRGDVSVKTDTFSYGVVLLELISGQPAFDNTREESSDIVSYLDEILGEVLDMIDWTSQVFNRMDFAKIVPDIDVEMMDLFVDKACEWNDLTKVNLVVLGRFCIEQRKKNRPMIVEVLNALEKIHHSLTTSSGV